jgi:type IV pilus biogenesis protein CpaD/CtpE
MLISKQTLKTVFAVITMLAFVCGCATSPKMQTVQVGDNLLTKDQITCELSKLDETQQKINSNKGVTGTNVAALLFFWPALAYTYIDAKDATQLVEARRSHLTSLYNQKAAQENGKKSPRRDA